MRLALVGLTVLLTAGTAAAQDIVTTDFLTTHSARDVWRVDWAAVDVPAAASAQQGQQDAGQPLHAAAIEHSDAYQTRAKIHKYASFATLPLFATEFALGQSMYNGDNTNLKGLHAGLGIGIVSLFGVNTVTGAWNLFGEGWSEKDGRTLRLVHGLLMMAADAGFVASSMSGPNTRRPLSFETDKVTHRNIAVASMSVGTASYLLMFIANHH